MKASPVVSSLNAGEFSPLLSGRSDLQKYPSSLRLSKNFITRVQGPATRRGGTYFISPVKDADERAWFVRFEFSATQAWVLEFGDEYVRFYTDHGRVVVTGVSAWSAAVPYGIGDLVEEGGVNYYCIAATTNNQPPNATYWYPLEDDIYEIPSPYALADLTNPDGTCALKYELSGDVIYIANNYRTYVPQKLTRHGNTDWQFSDYAPNTGPFLEMNTTSKTMYASANTGSVTLHASAGTFTSTDVGRLVRLEVQDFDVQPWETNIAYSLNDLVRYDGKTYKCTDAGTSGTDPPIHEHGKAFDGQKTTACQWDYQDPGYAIFRITAFTSGAQVTATVIEDEINGLNLVPAALVGAPAATPSKRWQLGAWSDSTEYPGSVAMWRERLWWGGRQRYWGSVANDFENMIGDLFGEARADTAIWRILQAQDVNDILWLVGGDKMVIGTPGGEFIVDEITNTQPLGSGNIRHKRQSKYRCRAVQPLAIGTKILYVQRAGRKPLAMGYDFNTDAFASDDLAILADRMTRTGIVDWAYQSEPFQVVWCVLANGLLIGLTYNERQEVTGLHRHPIGGTNVAVESVACIPAPDGLSDELWLIVRRTVNGDTVRYVEYMKRPWEGLDNDGTAGDSPYDAFYVDSGLTYTAPPATVSLSNVTVQKLGQDIVTRIETTADHNLLVGQTIEISGVNATGSYLINGACTVLAVTGAQSARITNPIKNLSAVTGSYISGGSFPSIAALATTISGLDHLIGETVQVLADAAVHPDCMVDADGEITLDYAPSVAHVGLPCPARLVTSDLETGGPAGTSQGKKSRISACGVRFVDTGGGKIGKPDIEDLSRPSTLDLIDWRVPSDPMNQGPPFRTAVVDVTFPGDWEREKCIEIVQDQPLPMTVAALMPKVHVNDG